MVESHPQQISVSIYNIYTCITTNNITSLWKLLFSSSIIGCGCGSSRVDCQSGLSGIYLHSTDHYCEFGFFLCVHRGSIPTLTRITASWQSDQVRTVSGSCWILEWYSHPPHFETNQPPSWNSWQSHIFWIPDTSYKHPTPHLACRDFDNSGVFYIQKAD